MTQRTPINSATDGYIALARAIILQAAQDAQKGDIDAALYLTLDGADLADAVDLDIEAARKFIANTFGWPIWALQPLGLSHNG